MVNNVVLEYLRVNKGNYKLPDLRAKVISSGYSKEDVDEAMVELNKQTAGKIPEVHETVKKINETNLPIEKKADVSGVVKPAEGDKVVDASKVVDATGAPKKSKMWLWILIAVLLLVIGGVAAWFFLW